MEQNQIDRRVRRTKRQLRAALTKLIEKKNVKEITVKELAEAADINRGTFYIHYRDVYHLIEQTEQDILDEFHELVRNYTENPETRNPHIFLMQVFAFFADKSDLCIALISKNGDMDFLHHLKDVVKNCGLREWVLSASRIRQKDFDYCYDFIASGCVGLFQRWVATGMQETPEEMAVLAEHLILRGIRVPSVEKTPSENEKQA